MSIKELIDKILAYIRLNRVITVTKTGTINGNGALSLSDIVPVGANILSIRTSSDPNALCIPWVYNNASWYVSVIYWTNFSTTYYANRSMTFTVKYVMGGGVLHNSISKAFDHLQKIGGGVDESQHEGAHGACIERNPSTHIRLIRGQRLRRILQGQTHRQVGVRLWLFRKWLVDTERRISGADYTSDRISPAFELLLRRRSDGRHGADHRTYRHEWCDIVIHNGNNSILDVFSGISCSLNISERGWAA